MAFTFESASERVSRYATFIGGVALYVACCVLLAQAGLLDGAQQQGGVVDRYRLRGGAHVA